VKWRQVLDALTAQKTSSAPIQSWSCICPPQSWRSHGRPGASSGLSAFWKRDLVSAQKLFRHAAFRLGFSLKDLRHIAVALMPFPFYRWLVLLSERSRP